MTPELKYEEGKLIAKVSVGLDTDKDGVKSVGADVVIFIDAKEAFSEIIKQEIPQWLKDLLSKFSGNKEETPVVEAPVEPTTPVEQA